MKKCIIKLLQPARHCLYNSYFFPAKISNQTDLFSVKLHSVQSCSGFTFREYFILVVLFFYYIIFHIECISKTMFQINWFLLDFLFNPDLNVSNCSIMYFSLSFLYSGSLEFTFSRIVNLI